jgi:flavin reductase (DIM6/NTAB) family NADH-FMN oxidoreductase RutF
MRFDFRDLARLERYKLLIATIMPRPIAWTTTRDENGAINTAPFSFFNVLGPDTVGISWERNKPAPVRRSQGHTIQYTRNS